MSEPDVEPCLLMRRSEASAYVFNKRQLPGLPAEAALCGNAARQAHSDSKLADRGLYRHPGRPEYPLGCSLRIQIRWRPQSLAGVGRPGTSQPETEQGKEGLGIGSRRPWPTAFSLGGQEESCCFSWSGDGSRPSGDGHAATALTTHRTEHAM